MTQAQPEQPDKAPPSLFTLAWQEIGKPFNAHGMTEQQIWQEYERRKRMIPAGSPDAYEAAIRRITAAMGT